MENPQIDCINVDKTVAGAACAAAKPSTSKAAAPEFFHLAEIRVYIYRAIASICDECFGKHINRLLQQFECAIIEELNIAQQSPSVCHKLARKIISLTNLIHSLLARRVLESNVSQLYYRRMCHIVANYIACELGGARQRVEKEQCIIERISSMLSLYVESGDAYSGAHKENTLCTLVAIPKLFGQSSIITVFYRGLFPQWSASSSVFSQAELSDKIYIEYIIIFYNWYRLETDKATKHRILEFASQFMRPSCTLSLNTNYRDHLPKYNAPNTATRCILDHLSQKQFCNALRTASKLDNRLTPSNIVEIDSDREESEKSFAVMLTNVLSSTTISLVAPNPEPPDFLKPLCREAVLLEPVKRATALYRGIDKTREVIDLCESDDDVDMFNLDFTNSANVDCNGSSSNEAPSNVEEDLVPITSIYPTNLRTYQRATSCAATVTSPVAVAGTYTMPRIVNSYSCQNDSLYWSPQQAVNQCVQTTESGEELQQPEDEQQLCSNDAILYSNNRLSTELPDTDPYSRMNTPVQYNHSHSYLQPSSLSTCRSESLLQKKQVTFSAQHLGASKVPKFGRSLKPSKPSIKCRTSYKNTSKISHSPSSSTRSTESLKKMARKEHFLAGLSLFNKMESKKNCYKKIDASLSSRRYLNRQVADEHFHSSTVATTPTTSNASSGTPTPQPRGPQRSLITPPTSTHSSCDINHRRKSTDSVHSFIDLNLLQEKATNYKFNRHKFADTSMDNANYYNNLIKLQRQKLSLKRQQLAKETRTSNMESTNVHSTKILDDQPKIINATGKKRILMGRKMIMPVVRLKRISSEDLKKIFGNVNDINGVNTNQEQPVKLKPTRRGRRPRVSHWTAKKKVIKKETGTPSAVTETTSENASAIPVSPVPTVCTAVLADVIPSGSPSTDSDLGIAAYVTLAANGESYEEQDTGSRPIRPLSTSSPETESNNVLVAHEIEVATSNVPVYLLNGESRDVTTPLPVSLVSDSVSVET